MRQERGDKASKEEENQKEEKNSFLDQCETGKWF